jgi:peptidoglycan L-alanyl-D-glutamate endopeptidase CwlK
MKRIRECAEPLQAIAHELIKEMDITVLCGYRGKDAQNLAFQEKRSKFRFPNSKHNVKPSLAIDLAPYPLDWDNTDRFKEMCARVELIAMRLGIDIKLGRDFSFVDWPHIQLG